MQNRHALVQIVDRPTQGHKFLSRQYVQPQWVIDSANFRVLAKAELYGVGMVPPPHLSPFVQTEEEGYVPDYLQTMLKLQVKHPQMTLLTLTQFMQQSLPSCVIHLSRRGSTWL